VRAVAAPAQEEEALASNRGSGRAGSGSSGT
jgi:hypothetical protein